MKSSLYIRNQLAGLCHFKKENHITAKLQRNHSKSLDIIYRKRDVCNPFLVVRTVTEYNCWVLKILQIG